MSIQKLPTALFALAFCLAPSLSSASELPPELADLGPDYQDQQGQQQMDQDQSQPAEMNLDMDADYVDIYGGRRGGYDTAYCPNGYRIQSCQFDRYCTNVQQGSNYCSASSHNYQLCQFRGRCVRPNRPNRPNPPGHRVTIQGGRKDGYDTAYCPNGYRIQSCSFNFNTCDNTQQGYNYCTADSRNHQYCQFSGVCVSN